MRIEELRTLHQARPFRPFAIHTADGRTFPIRHCEFLAYDQEGLTVVALQNDHTFRSWTWTSLPNWKCGRPTENPVGAQESNLAVRSPPLRREGEECCGRGVLRIHSKAISPLAPADLESHISAMNTERIDPAELDAYDAWVAQHLDEMVR